MDSESEADAYDALDELRKIAARIEAINSRFGQENKRMRAAIILLTDALDVILPFVVADDETVASARADNEAARLAVIIPPLPLDPS